MIRILLAAVLALSSVSAVVAAETYTVATWPMGINELPCSAFRQNGPDSWTLVATVKSGGLTLSDVTFVGHNPETKMIEAKCVKNDRRHHKAARAASRP